MKITNAVSAIGIDAIFDDKFRNSLLGRLLPDMSPPSPTKIKTDKNGECHE
jgi:hypothetical protein